MNSSHPIALTLLLLACPGLLGQPVITTQPAGQILMKGDTATFQVEVAPGTPPFHYQWQKNGTSIPGTDSSSYTTPKVTRADNGAQYRCIVYNSQDYREGLRAFKEKRKPMFRGE